jgi:hypothetical protein
MFICDEGVQGHTVQCVSLFLFGAEVGENSAWASCIKQLRGRTVSKGIR